jgi:hypothetical protein
MWHSSQRQNNQFNSSYRSTKEKKTQTYTEKKKQWLRYHNTWFQTTLQNHSNKTSMVVAKNKCKEQWNRIEYPNINPHSYSPFDF